ncbi:MAG: hypothetical protein QNK85_05280 [Crocinitomicaceae bacterium]
MKIVLIILLLIFGLTDGYSQLSKTEYEGVVEYFLDCIRNTDFDKLDSIISYPIQRPYPIPPIKNKQELKNRYSEIFDDRLTSLITSSNIKEDWSNVGWRGIMLENGVIWLDIDGSFITTNYTSDKEKDIEEKWIEYEKGLLYNGLKKFIKPIHTIETDKFIVRVDLLENQKYRYASWSKKSDLSNKPDLVINNGEWYPDGSGGNHHFSFKNGEYNYVVYVTILGASETPPFNLEVSKNDKVILNQSAKLKELK